MASNAISGDFDFDPNRILVAIDAHRFDSLKIPGGLSLLPELLAGA
jgi:hypothetical protein